MLYKSLFMRNDLAYKNAKVGTISVFCSEDYSKLL